MRSSWRRCVRRGQIRVDRYGEQLDDELLVGGREPDPVGGARALPEADVVARRDPLSRQADLELVAVQVEDLAAVEPERGRAVELRRPRLELREARPQPLRQRG